jgi:hypothetical protein
VSNEAEARVHEMIAAACLAATSDAEFTANLRAFLEAKGLDPADAAAILASPPRLALYRRLIRNNLVGVTERMLPRTRARLDAAAPGAFAASFATFLDEAGPRTPYLRDVPGEFLAWVLPRWSARADLPAWLGELARHEWTEFQLAAEPTDPPPPPVTEVALERPLVLRGPVRVLRYAFAVHELPAAVEDRSEPRAEPTALLAYRSAEHEVLYLKLHPALAMLTEELLRGARLGDAVQRAAAATGANGTELLEGVTRYLADLGERGVLLGARA